MAVNLISLVAEWDVVDVESDGYAAYGGFLSQEHPVILHQVVLSHADGGVEGGAGAGNVLNVLLLIGHLHD